MPTVDHITICGPDLTVLQNAFAAAGLVPVYGGPHASGITHMALLGFPDGSYLELIAPLERAETSPWAKLMFENSGAGAWAVGTQDIHAEVARLRSQGIAVTDPAEGSRRRPDGKLLEWITASVGPGAPGALLPFMIQDRTARELRVQPSAEPKGIAGVASVLLGVENLERAIALFQRAYGWPEPLLESHAEFSATVAHFPGTPVMLAASSAHDSWLAQRTRNFGEIPAAFFLHTSAPESFHLAQPCRWFGSDAFWFDSAKLCGVRLALLRR